MEGKRRSAKSRFLNSRPFVSTMISICKLVGVMPPFLREAIAQTIAVALFAGARSTDHVRSLKERQFDLVQFSRDLGSSKKWGVYGMYKARARYWMDVAWNVGASESRIRKELAGLINDPALQAFKEPVDGKVGNLAGFTHSGSYHLTTLALALSGRPTSLMYYSHGPLSDAGTDRMYGRFDVHLIPITKDRAVRAAGARQVLDDLRAGSTVCIAVDVAGHDGDVVSMGGSKIQMATGPSSFTRTSRKPLIPIAIDNKRFGRAVIVGEPVKIAPKTPIADGSQSIADAMSKVLARQTQPWEPPQQLASGHGSGAAPMAPAAPTAATAAKTKTLLDLRPAVPQVEPDHQGQMSIVLRPSVPAATTVEPLIAAVDPQAPSAATRVRPVRTNDVTLVA